MMFVTAITALASSFLILVLSRTAGALHSGQVDFPSASEVETKQGLGGESQTDVDGPERQ